MNPIIPTNRGDTICQNFSPVASECLQTEVNRRTILTVEGVYAYLELTNATIVANAQGGAHSRKVIFREYPRVAVRAR